MKNFSVSRLINHRNPFISLLYRFFMPTSTVAKEANLVAAYNDAPQHLRDSRLLDLAGYLVTSHSLTKTDANTWVSRTGLVEVMKDDSGYGITIFGGNVLNNNRLTPHQAKEFSRMIIESLPGDRRTGVRPS